MPLRVVERLRQYQGDETLGLDGAQGFNQRTKAATRTSVSVLIGFISRTKAVGSMSVMFVYILRARKAIQGYFGPDSTQYAQAGGTRASDRKSGGRRVKAATVPEAA